jgi:NADH-quinone oxidoreductase subunit F
MPIVLPADLNRTESLAAYRARGGYQGLGRARSLGPDAVIAEIEAAGLRGRGGAAFPTAAKWRMVRTAPGNEKFLVVNGAEGEPGSMKDRVAMARIPHAVLEGILIAVDAIGVSGIKFYVNNQFADSLCGLEAALQEAGEAGLLETGGGAPVRVELVPETHVYIAGEETALLNVLMGRPAVPWHKPPYPSDKGLFERPTAVNNVETLAQAAAILRLGGEAYRRVTPMLFSLSGDVARPGVYEMPLGTPLASLIEAAGGMARGEAFRAVLPGGYSTPMLGAESLHLPLDYDAVRDAGSGLGCSIIVVGSGRSLATVARDVMEFFAIESCGRCPTCVRGTRSLADALEGVRQAPTLGAEAAADLIAQAQRLRHKGICSFLDTASRFTETALGQMTGPPAVGPA